VKRPVSGQFMENVCISSVVGSH